ncbi:hypothetical protein GCM10027062_18900 [Nocardioides hungaricus]
MSIRLTDPRLTFAFEVRVLVGEPFQIGRDPRYEHWFTPITGGTVSGPRLSGEVLPYGGDWWSVGSAGDLVLDARYFLRTDDAAIIDIRNPGRFTPPEGFAADGSADGSADAPADPADHWGEAFPVFDTASPEYKWLTTSHFVGRGHDDDGTVHLRFFTLEYSCRFD